MPPRTSNRKEAQSDNTGAADVLNFTNMQAGDENAYVGDAGSGGHNNNVAPPPPPPHHPHTSTAGQAPGSQGDWPWTQEDENLALNMVANAATAAHPASSQEAGGGAGAGGGAAERDEQAAAQQLGSIITAEQQQNGEGGEGDDSNKRTAEQMMGEEGEHGFAMGGGKRPRPVDPSKRAQQNRAAQKAFRERRDEKFKKLEEQAQYFASVEAENAELKKQLKGAEQLIATLQGENGMLRNAIDAINHVASSAESPTASLSSAAVPAPPAAEGAAEPQQNSDLPQGEEGAAGRRNTDASSGDTTEALANLVTAAVSAPRADVRSRKRVAAAVAAATAAAAAIGAPDKDR